MNPEEIKALLADHQQWLGSETKEGKRADLSGANLEAADLHGANLRGANLRKANLSRCNLEGANLRGADLREANLQQAALSGTTLFEADLAGADLSNARGLLAGQLGGTNTSGAKLPEEVSQFKELDTVGELSRTAGALFLSLLVACFYACLTITATVDVHLLTNSTASKLPIIQTEIPIVVFYTAAPLVLLALYVCYHLYLQRLWEALAELPAVLPDGTTLDQKSYPMLLTDLVRAQFVQLRARRLPLFRLRERLSLLLAWWLVPATLFLFWLRYLTRHEWLGTVLHILVLCGSVGAGLAFYRLAVATLGQDDKKLRWWLGPWRDRRTLSGCVALVTLGLILLLFSSAAIEGVPPDRYAPEQTVAWDVPHHLPLDPRRCVPWALERIGCRPFADFREADVSTKPASWSGALPEGDGPKAPPLPDEVNQVKGAYLKGRDLRYATGFRAFLVKANLEGADLRGADLWNADLRGADLGRANLARAHLGSARLDEARMPRANCEGTYLNKAYLRKANLRGAILRGADLRGAKLQEAFLAGADLSEAHLEAADLRGAHLDAEHQPDPRASFDAPNLEGMVYDTRTLWPEKFDPKQHRAKLIEPTAGR